MSRIFYVLVAIIIMTSCGFSPRANEQEAILAEQKEYIEVLYFHGKQRCITCNAIEKLTKEVIDNNFAEQLKNGKVVFRVIDISTKEGEIIADRYEVTWSSLYINRWDNGKECRNNMTEFGFSNAKNSPEVFKAGVKKRIDEVASATSNN